MKTATNRRFIHVALILFMATALMLSASPQAAQAQDATPTSSNTYIIPVPLPKLDEIDLPAARIDLDRVDPDWVNPNWESTDWVKRLTTGLLAKEADQILEELRHLQDSGVVENYELLTDTTAIRVTLAEENKGRLLQSLPEMAELVAQQGDEVPACVYEGADRLPQMVKAAQQVQAQRASRAQADPEALASAAPVINIYYEPYSDYASIFGTAAPNSEVRLRILRGGSQVALDYDWSYADGSFYLYPAYYPCGQGGEAWQVKAGDVVEISVGGLTTSTTVTPIQGWADPETNVISGVTAANRTVKAEIYQMDRGNPCADARVYMVSGKADANGNFSINASSAVNFDRSADVILYATDAAGNSSYYYASTYHLQVYDWKYYYFDIKPSTDYTLVLKRGATTVETISGTTDEWGGVWGYFSNPVLAGDQATLSFTSGMLTYKVVNNPVLSVNRDSGQISGNAPAGLIALADRYTDTYSIKTRCSYSDACASQTVPSNGSVSLNLGRLYKGDDAVVQFITPEGEYYWGSSFFEPSLEAYPTEDYLNIIWWYTDELTVTLKDSANSVKETVTFDNNGSWYSNYWVDFNVDMVAGDHIEVTDGDNITRTMTVSTFDNLRLNYNTNRVTGSAAAGHLLATVGTMADDVCVETDHSGGSYSLNPGVDVLGDRSAHVNLRGSDGYYTVGYNWSLGVYLAVFDTYGNVYTETANTTLNWTHKRNGVTIGNGTGSVSDRWGYFSLSEAAQPGDVLEITTGDGNQATIIYPELTILSNTAEQLTYGKAPANQRVEVEFNRDMTDYVISNSFNARSDGSGNFSAHVPIRYWSYDCKLYNLNNACQTLRVSADMANGFSASTAFLWPAPVAADAYESDDTPNSAKSYTGFQQHSLHLSSDVDWVKFTISAEDAANAVPFSIRVVNSGINLGLTMELYSETNLSAPLASAWGANDFSGNVPPTIDYVFSQAGTYYLKIYPDTYDGGHCASVYTLAILRDPKSVFLPEVTR